MAKATAKPAPKPKKGKREERPVIYKEESAEILSGRDGKLLTPTMAKKNLGWQTEEEAGVEFGEDYMIKDRLGHKVRLVNNDNNRPIYMSNVEGLRLEQIEGRWRYNGQTIIITDTGRVGNGQHQQLALIFAQQDIDAEPERWAEKWPDGKIAIPNTIVYGIADDDAVLNTMDGGKPRTLTDVLFRSDFLKDTAYHLRKSLANMLSYSVRVLWERTGAMRASDAYNPGRTNGELIDFLVRHERLVKAVKHVWAEDEQNALSKYVKAGTAGALMYLMAASQTDPDAGYFDARRETKLKFPLWDKAGEFFTLLRDSKELKPIRDAIQKFEDEDGNQTISPQERIALVILGWRAFLANGKVTTKDLNLVYHTDEDSGETRLVEHPTIGGIDLGPKVNQADEEEEGLGDTDLDAESEAELEDMGDGDFSAEDGEEAQEMSDDDTEVDMEEEEVKPKGKKVKAKK